MRILKSVAHFFIRCVRNFRVRLNDDDECVAALVLMTEVVKCRNTNNMKKERLKHAFLITRKTIVN